MDPKSHLDWRTSLGSPSPTQATHPLPRPPLSALVPLRSNTLSEWAVGEGGRGEA